MLAPKHLLGGNMSNFSDQIFQNNFHWGFVKEGGNHIIQFMYECVGFGQDLIRYFRELYFTIYDDLLGYH